MHFQWVENEGTNLPGCQDLLGDTVNGFVLSVVCFEAFLSTKECIWKPKLHTLGAGKARGWLITPLG
jgi:hypothetical protein